MRVFDSIPGKTVAERLGISEPTVSRHLQRVRTLIRERLMEMIATYSFTEEERSEATTAGLGLNDTLFDEALCEIYLRHAGLVDDESRLPPG